MTDDYKFNYDCPICGHHEIYTIRYIPESEPNQYGREKLREHLIEKHSEELVLKYLTEKYAYQVANDLTKEMRAKHYQNKKLHKSKKNFIMRYLSK